MIRNVKMDKLNDMFGFTGAKPVTDEVTPDESARKSTEPAAKPAGAQQAAKRDAPAEKPADEAKNKAPAQPADALNIAKVVLNVQ
jgi:FtsZ-interacting cell division protein YlmF